MAEHNVTITAGGLTPSTITIRKDDTIVWINSTTLAQTASSDDGETFTTGLIPASSQSLPIIFLNTSEGIPYSCPSGLTGTVIVEGAVSFIGNIKPFFTEIDRNAMMDATHTFGIITFDLWSRDDCEANWDAIKTAIANGSMPPPGDDSDGPWAQSKIDKFVDLFQRWKADGFQP
jgi:hypothetical protein